MEGGNFSNRSRREAFPRQNKRKGGNSPPLPPVKARGGEEEALTLECAWARKLPLDLRGAQLLMKTAPRHLTPNESRGRGLNVRRAETKHEIRS